MTEPKDLIHRMASLSNPIPQSIWGESPPQSIEACVYRARWPRVRSSLVVGRGPPSAPKVTWENQPSKMTGIVPWWKLGFFNLFRVVSSDHQMKKHLGLLAKADKQKSQKSHRFAGWSSTSYKWSYGVLCSVAEKTMGLPVVKLHP